jgi:alkanesulfonate monooxygenase SsuD/methylene tetrahydromethanopterin reductase-like flavin-dependent oxidoreductase (luciferase family)
MKFGLFCDFQVPRPWDKDSDHNRLQEILDQVELADRLGIQYVWATEHHFLEEYSHNSAPEMFLAAAAMRTKNIRLAHGIMTLPPQMNHPIRCAERIAFLDQLSNGRVEFGTGESSSEMELAGFNIDRADKRAMWEEALPAIARMMVEEPFTGHVGKFFSAPPRNVLPKPRQSPHPPLWVACGKRDTINMAARNGLGALSFSFMDPGEATGFAQSYYQTFESEATPLGYAMNPNLAMTTTFMCCKDEQEAIDKAIDGAHFFAYGYRHYFISGDHRPAQTNLWDNFQRDRASLGMSKENLQAVGAPLTATVRVEAAATAAAGTGSEAESMQKALETILRGSIGTPEQIRDYLRAYEEAGVDQMILVVQTGNTTHQDICASLELFAREVMPEFVERDRIAQRRKDERLRPIIAKALAARRPQIPPPGFDPDYSVHAAGAM